LFGESSVKRRRILVQGAGDVGGSLIRLLREAGAEVLFSEVNDALVGVFRDELGLRHVDAAAVYSTECDIFSPCALGGVLNASTIPQLRCRAVAGSANNQLENPEDAESLRSRGILYAPDYVINAGGAIAVLGIELQRWTPHKAEDEVVNSVRRNLGQIFESAASGGITTEAAARRLAERRLHAET
jgi:leucine dehydrogenase